MAILLRQISSMTNPGDADHFPGNSALFKFK